MFIKYPSLGRFEVFDCVIKVTSDHTILGRQVELDGEKGRRERHIRRDKKRDKETKIIRTASCSLISVKTVPYHL